MQAPSFERRYVYDGLLRFIHWWNALTILLLIASALVSEAFEHGPLERTLWQTHVFLGYGLIGGLVARFVWGVVGPQSARLSDLWHPRSWLQVVQTRRLPTGLRQGHDPLASLAFLIVYALLLIMVGTGLALTAIELDMGPLATSLGDSTGLKKLFKEPHEFVFNLIWMFILVHIGALMFHEWRGRVRIARSMLTGYRYHRADGETKGTGHA